VSLWPVNSQAGMNIVHHRHQPTELEAPPLAAASVEDGTPVPMSALFDDVSISRACAGTSLLLREGLSASSATHQSTFYSLLLLPKLAQCQQPAKHSATGKH